MPYGYSSDPELDRSTNRVIAWAAGLTLAMAAVFPLYLWYEPGAREDNREAQLASLASEGESLWGFNCAACHGADGTGGTAPALNAEQFLQSATDEQISQLIAVGVPGTPMSAYSQDFAGPMTSEQIKAVTTYIRSWEDDAPDNPDWRSGEPAAGASSSGEAAGVPSDDLVGRDLFEESCASCHGTDLEGVGDFPGLGLGSDAVEEPDSRLTSRIVEGRNEMPAFGDDLTDEQIDSLVEYIRRVQNGEA